MASVGGSKDSGKTSNSPKSSSSPKTVNGVTKNGSITTGAKGAKVTSIQKQLNAAGYKVTANGKFDAATKKAVESFQAKSKLKADGFVGASTMKALSGAKPGAAKPGAVADAPKGPAGKNKTGTITQKYANGMKSGTVTINGRTYKFNSGGAPGYPGLPKGTYKVSNGVAPTKKQERTMKKDGVAYKYNMSDKFDPATGKVRTALRFHPDGGGVGTWGCIGIVGNGATQRQFQSDMNAEIKRNGGSFNFTMN